MTTWKTTGCAMGLVLLTSVSAGYGAGYKTRLSPDGHTHREARALRLMTGKAKLKVKKGKMKVKVKVKRGRDVHAAYLRCGFEGQEGPVVVTLRANIVCFFGICVPAGVPKVNGTFVKKTFNAGTVFPDVGCSDSMGMDIETVEDLEDAISKGGVYVEVVTLEEGPRITGQLE